MIDLVRPQTARIVDGANDGLLRVAVVRPLSRCDTVTDPADGPVSRSVTRLARSGAWASRSPFRARTTETPPARLLRRIVSP
jgi:hypothetical protein